MLLKEIEVYPYFYAGNGNVFTYHDQERFIDSFVSEKLDLVFVLDTHPKMEPFYRKGLFSSDFLNRFQDYEWRFAYTDMSVGKNKIKEAKIDKNAEESCLSSDDLLNTVFAALLEIPFLFIFGIKKAIDCIPEGFLGDEDKFANGKFLPFEYKEEKINFSKINYMTKYVENYNEIFTRTLKLEDKKNSYDAPEQKNHDSYPYLSMSLSMRYGSQSDSEQGGSFFRKDSVIVYVLFTIHDLDIEHLPDEKLEAINSFFGSKKRVKIIPVILPPDSPDCLINLQHVSSASPKLKNWAGRLGYPSLNICSNDLEEKLFDEISKPLIPMDLLN